MLRHGNFFLLFHLTLHAHISTIGKRLEKKADERRAEKRMEQACKNPATTSELKRSMEQKCKANNQAIATNGSFFAVK